MANMTIAILYGSETGTAQDVAEQIWKCFKRYGLHSTVNAMNECNVEQLVNEKVIICVVSTAGQGDTPLNMKTFWKFLLRKSLPSDFLTNKLFAVLGLGDSSFEKFNFVGKKLNKRLLQLGATELISIGLADDQHDLGVDAVFEPWLESLTDKIHEKFSLPKKIVFSDHEIVQRFHIETLTDEKLLPNIKQDIYLYEAKRNNLLIRSVVSENIRTTSYDHFQDVRLIKFRIPNVTYSPGDILYIRAKNSDSHVNTFFDILKYHGANVNPDAVLKISEKDIKLPIVLNQKLTLRQVVQQYWDLNMKPKRSTLHILALMSKNKLEKKKLLELTTMAGKEDFHNYINRPRRNIIEVLNDFPHTTSQINVKMLFEIMSPVKPRAFSIASSLLNNKDELHLLVAVVRYKTKLLEPRYGICSNWLASLKPGDDLIFWIQKGTFKFDYQKPMILVGPGTGIAPFRALLFDKAAKDKELSSCLVFFGCRFEKKDYHCRDDFALLVDTYQLKLFCAFSRDQPQKIYVQHMIRQHSKVCWNFLKNGGKIYLAGNCRNMPNAVREEFITMAESFGKMNKERAKSYVRSLEKNGMYQVETW